MAELRFATELEPELEVETIDCRWSSVIRGVERYAAYQPAGAAEDLRQWVDLLEGIRQLRDD